MEGRSGWDGRDGIQACGGKPVGTVTGLGDLAIPSTIMYLSVVRLLRTVINDGEQRG
jgi:hypothetical protein